MDGWMVDARGRGEERSVVSTSVVRLRRVVDALPTLPPDVRLKFQVLELSECESDRLRGTEARAERIASRIARARGRSVRQGAARGVMRAA